MSNPSLIESFTHHSPITNAAQITHLYAFNDANTSVWPQNLVVHAAQQLATECWSRVCLHPLYNCSPKYLRFLTSGVMSQLKALDFSKQAAIILGPCSEADFVGVMNALKEHEFNLADLFPQLQEPAEHLPHLMVLNAAESTLAMPLAQGASPIKLEKKLRLLSDAGLWLDFPLRNHSRTKTDGMYFQNPFDGLNYEGLTPLQLAFVLNTQNAFEALSNLLGFEITYMNLRNLVPYAVHVFEQVDMQHVLTRLLKYDGPAWHAYDGKTALHDIVVLGDDAWFSTIAPLLEKHYLNQPQQFLNFLATIDEEGYTAIDRLGLNVNGHRYQALCSWMDSAMAQISNDEVLSLRQSLLKLLEARCLYECIALHRTPERFSEGLAIGLSRLCLLTGLGYLVFDNFRVCHEGLWRAFCLQQMDVVLAARTWAQSQLLFDSQRLHKESFLDAAVRYESTMLMQMELDRLLDEYPEGLVPYEKRLHLEYVHIEQFSEAQLNLVLRIAQNQFFFPRTENINSRLLKHCVTLDHVELFNWLMNYRQLQARNVDLVKCVSQSSMHTSMVHRALLLGKPKIMNWLANGSGVSLSTWCRLTTHRLKKDVFDSLRAMNLQVANVYPVVANGYNPLQFDKDGLPKLSYLLTSLQLTQAVTACIHANHQGSDGQNALHHAFRDLHKLQLPVNSEIYTSLAQRDSKGLAPLHHALIRIKFWGVHEETLQKSVDSILYLLERGPAFIEDFGTLNSPWRLVASSFHFRIPRKLILQMLAYSGVKSTNGQHSQILGVIWADLLEGGCKAKAVYETLAQFGVPVSWQSTAGENLFHFAIRGMQSRAVIQYLFDLGISSLHVASNQRTPLDLAVLFSHQAFQELYQQHMARNDVS